MKESFILGKLLSIFILISLNWSTQTIENFYKKHTTYLSSDKLEGRGNENRGINSLLELLNLIHCMISSLFHCLLSSIR